MNLNATLIVKVSAWPFFIFIRLLSSLGLHLAEWGAGVGAGFIVAKASFASKRS